VKYKVNWDNGESACGTFPQVFDTEDDAQEFADSWVNEMCSRDGIDPDSEDAYFAEVIQVPEEAKYDEEEGLRPEFWA
jgi:hypothetical protein